MRKAFTRGKEEVPHNGRERAPGILTGRREKQKERHREVREKGKTHGNRNQEENKYKGESEG